MVMIMKSISVDNLLFSTSLLIQTSFSPPIKPKQAITPKAATKGVLLGQEAVWLAAYRVT